MKRLALAFMVSAVLTLTACSSTNEEHSENKKDSKKNEESGQSLGVEKGLLNVEVTIPSTFFEDQDMDSAIAEAKESGIKDVTKNEDGSITYKMSKNEHKKLLKEMKSDVTVYVDELINNEEFASISDINFNAAFSEFTVIVDKDAYENSFDGFATLGLGMVGMYYQLFDGVQAEKMSVTVNTQDANTGETINSVVYPDAFEE